MVTIKNQYVTLQISEVGAEMQSLIIGGREILWQGWSEIWSGRAPILFPVCGRLKCGSYTYNGKQYSLPQHGFARKQTFVAESVGDDSATFLLAANDETRACYPFEFELRAKYTLTNDGVKVTFNVKNVGENTMYFSIGSHEAYATPEGIEDYDIVFPQKETLDSFELDGGLLTDRKYPLIKNSTTLPLYDKYFLFTNPVIEGIKSGSATLRNRITGRFVRVDFPDKPYFLIWHKLSAPYMCLEPWTGIPDTQDSSGNIAEKAGITSLDSGCEFEVSHLITVGEE